MLQSFRALKKWPVVGPWVSAVHRALAPPPAFESSDEYWKTRYRKNGNSGAGSYGRLARFKADVLNEFVKAHSVGSVIEWGCGDGNQLGLAAYPSYVGVDISPDALALCRREFAADTTKRFMLYPDAVSAGAQAELALSLDVIYHLVEDATYDSYMRALTASGVRFIGIYSSDEDKPGHVPHVRHRSFSTWLATHAPQWKLCQATVNRYPFDPADPGETSWADFRFFGR